MVVFAVRELFWTLQDAWRDAVAAADLGTRLAVWWEIVSGKSQVA